jgi:hypothetical protein
LVKNSLIKIYQFPINCVEKEKFDRCKCIAAGSDEGDTYVVKGPNSPGPPEIRPFYFDKKAVYYYIRGDIDPLHSYGEAWMQTNQESCGMRAGI